MVTNNERLEHVTIGRGSFRNFSGERKGFNKTGKRIFSVFLPEDLALDLMDIGWYIKKRDPYREGDDPTYQFDIEASYDTKDGKFRPPVVKLKSWDGKETMLTEETVGILDTVDIDDATLEVRPYNWDVDGKSGCKAYLQELIVTAKPPRTARNATLRRDEDDDD